MKNDDYLKIMISYYVRLTDGTPYGLVFNKNREPAGVFIVTRGLNALKKHCFDPWKYKWVTLEMIESKRQEIVGRWDGMPSFARDDPWQIVCVSLTKENEVFVKDIVNNYCEDIKTNISEEE